ncbi:MAG: hypothetical protein B7Y01_04630 [Xanthobacter sp. 17-67-6]|nr:MAG: hypothetical protein B7Y01_04630 [Xanthobacter sp. 17-67-6]
MIINGETYACEACIRGHRTASCQHKGASPSSNTAIAQLTVANSQIVLCSSSRRRDGPFLSAITVAPCVSRGLRMSSVSVQRGPAKGDSTRRRLTGAEVRPRKRTATRADS